MPFSVLQYQNQTFYYTRRITPNEFAVPISAS